MQLCYWIFSTTVLHLGAEFRAILQLSFSYFMKTVSEEKKQIYNILLNNISIYLKFIQMYLY